MFPNLRFLLLGIAVAVLVTSPGGAQPARQSDEQRCTGQAGVTPDVQAAACTALIESGRFIADYDQALRLDPTLTAAVTGRGNAWRRSGNFDRAIADFDQVIRVNPK